MTRAPLFETRMGIIVRILGLIFLALGFTLAYFTSTTPIAQQALSTFYLIAALFIISGIITLIAKLK